MQALKAGILEIADVLVVNKSDREGADRAVRDLVHMLDLRTAGQSKEVEIIKTIAARGTKEGSGLEELRRAIENHREEQEQTETGIKRARQRAAAHLSELVRGQLADRAAQALASHGGLSAVAQDVAERKIDPYTAAEEIVAEL